MSGVETQRRRNGGNGGNEGTSGGHGLGSLTGIGAVQHAFQFLHDRATSLRAAMRRQAQGVADEGAGA